MKMTVEIADTLLVAARRLAAQERTSVGALIEQGLRTVVEDRSRRGFELRRATFGGEGLSPDLRADDWSAIRDRTYQDRGD
jgi:hypothetical protein